MSRTGVASLLVAACTLVVSCGHSEPAPELHSEPLVTHVLSVAEAAEYSELVVVGHVTGELGKESMSSRPSVAPEGFPDQVKTYVHYRFRIDEVVAGEPPDGDSLVLTWLYSADATDPDSPVPPQPGSGQVLMFMGCAPASRFPGVTLVEGTLCFPSGNPDGVTFDIEGGQATSRDPEMVSLDPVTGPEAEKLHGPLSVTLDDLRHAVREFYTGDVRL